MDAEAAASLSLDFGSLAIINATCSGLAENTRNTLHAYSSTLASNLIPGIGFYAIFLRHVCVQENLMSGQDCAEELS